jgi:GNAT superfamily N-acetyltransferase
MILRAAVPSDRDAVVTLGLCFHAETPYGDLLRVDPDRIGAQFDVALAHGVVFVAERDDVPGPNGPELIGFLALAALTHMLSGDHYAEEMGWFVLPAYRTGTLGPRLLRRAEEWAQANGCTFLKMAAPYGTTIGSFYARAGYQPIETAYLKRVA